MSNKRYLRDKYDNKKLYPSYGNAILNINKDAEFSIPDTAKGNPQLTKIWWGENTTPIPVEDIEAKYQELKTNWEAKNYVDGRNAAYPSIEEQLDMQYWDAVNGTTTWKDAIAKVKSDNPKE